MWTERFVTVNGVHLHVVEAGPPQGPLVVLLHGFPEFWRAWERQLGPLARAGLRVVAPDLRGYHLSDKPPGVEAYRVETLQEDVAALIRLLAQEQGQAAPGRASLVGHDWGGIVAWQVAIRQPELLEKLVILNAPHPAVSRRVMKKPEQQKKSWYVGFFQLPWLPERVLPLFGRWALRGTRADSFTPEALARYRRAWAQPGAPGGMINYYRALMRFGTRHGLNRNDPHAEDVRVPTLLIWGQKDAALSPEMAEVAEWVPDLRVVRLARASHWVMRDETVRVNNLLLDFLT